jgi:mRNA-degrading endonuclease RelE of RelBE toxin-antitoxin system
LPHGATTAGHASFSLRPSGRRQNWKIALAPTAWPVIRRTGGARKARAIRGARGKSGGARIIYYVVLRKGVLYLLDVYAKSEKEDLTDAETREIRKLIAALEAEA